MKLFSNPAVNIISVGTILLASLMMSGCGSQQAQYDQLGTTQQSRRVGIVSDWSTAHVIFSNPGTEQDAIQHGRQKEWQSIVNNPRYRMQQIARASAGSSAISGGELDIPHSNFRRPVDPPQILEPSALHADWAVTLRGGGFVGLFDRFPAKYTFSPIAAPDCANDFVVSGIGFAGSSNQANVVSSTNLYTGTCTGTVPSLKFAYWLGNGTFGSSPVISLDGTKLVLIESLTSSAIFHVLTIGTTGNNGTIWSTPACPGTVNGTPTTSCGTSGNPFNNNAVDVKIPLSSSAQIKNSSPYVDYTDDIAYIGDSGGHVHKITGVFHGTPTEVTTGGWPVQVGVGGNGLTDPVLDEGVSGHLFIGSSDGNVYCLVAATAAPCSVPSIAAGTSDIAGTGTGGVVGTPILDVAEQKLFVGGNIGANATLTQMDTSLGSVVRVAMGAGGSTASTGTHLMSGVGDNQYYTTGTGYWYFCGNIPSAAIPALRRVPVTNGVMSATPDSNFFELVLNGNGNTPGTANDCSPLTEYYNTGTGTDYLFVSVPTTGFTSVSNGGTAPNGTPNCNFAECVISFSLPTSAPPNTFPAQAFATVGPGTNPSLQMNRDGTSGMIVDNASTAPGTSQLYFLNYGPGTGVQVSQSALH